MRRLKKFKELWRFENSIELLLGLIFFKGTNALTYRYRGVRAYVDHRLGDQDGVRLCLEPGLYRPIYQQLFSFKRDQPLSFLDLGANTGGFPLSLLADGYQIEAGLSVELNPKTCDRLRLNLSMNELGGKVEALNAAACDKCGEIEVTLSDGSVGDSIVESMAEGGGKQVIQGYSVNELIKRRFGCEGDIDLCKIDIEGAEYEMFEGKAFQGLKRCKVIIIEIHQRDEKDEGFIHKTLCELGFMRVEMNEPLPEHNVFVYQRD